MGASSENPWALLPADWRAESRFDGGDTGCGEILLDLRIHFRPLAAGTRVAILARDEGAPIEVPAWCRLTGHDLLEARHPYYLVRTRGGAGPQAAPSSHDE
jgi:tRNA 2-thiouridine synthesizing protein A